jgi:hypothetical protein
MADAMRCAVSSNRRGTACGAGGMDRRVRHRYGVEDKKGLIWSHLRFKVHIVDGRTSGRAPLFAIAVLLVFAAMQASSLAAPMGPKAVVERKSARNEAVAERDAHHRLDLIPLPTGAVRSQVRPSGIGKRLRGPAFSFFGTRNVHATTFWTTDKSRAQMIDFLRNHAPRGARVETESFGSGGPAVEFGWRNAPRGVWYTSVVVGVAKRLGGGSALRADVTDQWELPRSPAARIPGHPRFLAVRIKPTGEGLAVPEEGQPEPPRPVPRFNSTERQSLIAGLVRLVEREPAYQITELPSCGPPPVGEVDLIELTFMDHRGGTVLATVSRKSSGGPCDALLLHPRGAGTYALDFGYAVMKRAQGLVDAGTPRNNIMVATTALPLGRPALSARPTGR